MISPSSLPIHNALVTPRYEYRLCFVCGGQGPRCRRCGVCNGEGRVLVPTGLYGALVARMVKRGAMP
jgi:hypothetical protein